MKILWFSWKDLTHPQAGGAEIVTHELLKRLVQDSHEVILITSCFPSANKFDERNGYKIVRVGSRVTVYWEAHRYYRKNLQNWANLVIDECNTIPFFAIRYVKCRTIMFFHQLCREIWFYQIAWPFSWIGYLVEPIYLRWLNRAQVITVSRSSSKDLQWYGFREENIGIISEGIKIEPLADLDSVEKFEQPTLLSLGAIRPMKRTMDILHAYELAKKKISNLRLIIAGSMTGVYGKAISSAISISPYYKDIQLIGPISDEKKIDLMRHSHLVVVTSVKEGWCLVVTEANSQGTPAVAYNVDGLRDSIRDGETGWLCAADPKSMAQQIVSALGSFVAYEKIRKSAWNWSKEITFDRAYRDFSRYISK